MATTALPEYWLRGPIEDVPPLLQPAAHALLQARDEISEALIDFPQELAWQQPAGVASVAFHLQHLTGVLDRLFTYAEGKQLNEQQLVYLAAEGKQHDTVTIESLITQFNKQVDKAIDQLKRTTATSLTESRRVGRKQIPSTVFGLIFHAAEHTMRHTGQLIVTIRLLKQLT
jgi:uncharacterized damage-inducible protein DinB